jgi:hypothetical protein
VSLCSLLYSGNEVSIINIYRTVQQVVVSSYIDIPQVHSGGSRHRRASRMQRHGRWQLHIQEVLTLMGIPRCEERYTRASLGIRRRTIKNRPENSPSEHSERRAAWTTWWTIRVLTRPCIRHGKYITGSRQDTMGAVRHLCSQLRPPNQELRPNASVQSRDTIQKDSQRSSRALGEVQGVNKNSYLLGGC